MIQASDFDEAGVLESPIASIPHAKCEMLIWVEQVLLVALRHPEDFDTSDEVPPRPWFVIGGPRCVRSDPAWRRGVLSFELAYVLDDLDRSMYDLFLIHCAPNLRKRGFLVLEGNTEIAICVPNPPATAA
jgi:hypothetical protein